MLLNLRSDERFRVSWPLCLFHDFDIMDELIFKELNRCISLSKENKKIKKIYP